MLHGHIERTGGSVQGPGHIGGIPRRLGGPRMGLGACARRGGMLALVLVIALAVEPLPPVPEVLPIPPPPRGDVTAMRLELEALNTRIRTMNTDWPLGSAAALYAGITVGSTALLVEGMLLLLATVSTRTRPPVGAHAGALVTATMGFTAAVVGVITGLNSATPARAEKARLVDERRALENELRTVERAAPVQVELPTATPFFSWTFGF